MLIIANKLPVDAEPRDNVMTNSMENEVLS